MHMGSDEVKKTVKDWFSGLADLYNAGIQKLTTQYDEVPESSWGLCTKMI
jgi:hypothetical protein